MQKTSLTFDVLREANKQRLPLFTRKDKDGNVAAAHAKPDGSDWSPKLWLIAMMGEVGETVEALVEGNEEKVSKEFADIQTYLDIAARRAYDIEKRDRALPYTEDHLALMMQNLGAICESYKKFARGDKDQFTHDMDSQPKLFEIMRTCMMLLEDGTTVREWEAIPHEQGVDLGAATISKFNEVSDRVGCDVKINDSGMSWRVGT